MEEGADGRIYHPGECYRNGPAPASSSSSNNTAAASRSVAAVTPAKKANPSPRHALFPFLSPSHPYDLLSPLCLFLILTSLFFFFFLRHPHRETGAVNEQEIAELDALISQLERDAQELNRLLSQ